MELDSGEKFRGALEFTRTVFGVSIASLPRESDLEHGEVIQQGYHFQAAEQLRAFENELCWAFLTRLDSIFEALWTRLKFAGAAVEAAIANSPDLSTDDKTAFKKLRVLRNVFHHGDGDWNLLKNRGNLPAHEYESEPQLTYEEVDAYAGLYRKLSAILIAKSEAEGA